MKNSSPRKAPKSPARRAAEQAMLAAQGNSSPCTTQERACAREAVNRATDTPTEKHPANRAPEALDETQEEKKMGEKRRRDMWANIPWQRRAQIVKQAKKKPDGLRKAILLLAFEAGLSTQEIHELAKDRPDLYSRNGNPISKRRVLQIIAEEVPDYNTHQKKDGSKKRSDHYKFNWAHRGDKVRCAFCGASDKLEWHHMIPVFLGGTAEDPNMVCVCHDCHKIVTEYQRGLFPDEFNPGKRDD